ncbi:MAG: hypothetical protein HFI29_11020 [Lachnospiraceae bacterium]|nr:hypothetical protein [Lachnospiraceae bacterium]
MRKNILKNISYAIGANIISLGLSLILSFFIPKILGVEEYGYWQLYSLIISYAGFFHLGMIDGIYLKLGGKRYSEINKELYHTIFVIFMLIISVCLVIAIGVFCSLNLSPDNKIVYIASGIAISFVLIYTYFDMIMEATNRIEDSSKLIVFFKISYFILVISVFILGYRSYKGMIVADILSKILVAVIAIRRCIDILKADLGNSRAASLEIVDNTRSGINLMLANIAGMLVTGITRFFIVGNWDMMVFGNISIALAIANLLFAFMSTLSVVFFPILRRADAQMTKNIYYPIRTIIVVGLFFMIGFYYPFKLIIEMWLPQYQMGLRYMALLFPMVIFESKSTLIFNTYLKNYNEEKAIFKVNIISVGICLVCSGLFASILHNLVLTVVSIVVVLIVKSFLLEINVCRLIDKSYLLNNLQEVVLSFIFIFISWYIDEFIGVALYFSAFAVYIILNKKFVINNIKEFLALFFRKG